LQRDRIEALAKAKGFTITEWHTDLNQSGGKYDRPGFQEAIGAIEDGRADVFLVAKLTRFARSVKDTANAVERIEAAGGFLVAGDCDVDPSTPVGKVIRGVLSLFAEFELDIAREQWQASKAKAIANGKKASRIPFGYSSGPDGRLVKNEDAPIVAELFRRSAARQAPRELLDYLHAATGTPFSYQRMWHMIGNRTYVGDVFAGQLVNAGAHEGIVTEDEWRGGQRESTRVKLKRSGTHSLLSGIARCKACGRKMHCDNSATVPVYKCPRNPRGACPEPASITTAALDVFVIEQLRAWTRAEGLEDVTHDVRPAEDAIEAARIALRSAEEDVEAFAVVSAELRLAPEAVRKGLETRQEAVRAARARLRDLEAVSAAATARTTLRAAWPELSTAERRQLVGSVIERVEVCRRPAGRRAAIEDRARIVWRTE
jgi:DNA invertase Pin-like site-specific DNA recombinase